MPIRGAKLRKSRPLRTNRDRAVLLTSVLVVVLAAFIAAVVGLPIDRYDATLISALSLLISVGITVVVTTFSFVFVALSLVSVQFSPRVVRHFWHGDRFRSIFLWSSVAVFAFCFAALFVTSPPVHLLAVLLGSYQVFVVFPAFLGYLADNINAASITKNISDKTINEIAGSLAFHPEAYSESDPSQVRSEVCGFLERIETERLSALFSELRGRYPELTFRSSNYLGSFIEVRSVLGTFDRDVDVDEGARAKIAACFVVGKFRSYDQDIEYGIRQLVDIGIKAISPAVNDPTTCVNCIHHLGVIIKELTVRDLQSVVAKRLETEGIILKEPSFEQYLDDAFDQIYQFGRRDHIIVRTILGVLAEVISVVPDLERAEIVVREVDEMELGYLFDGGRPCPFELVEHRNYLRKSLSRFYTLAADRIRFLGDEARSMELKVAADACMVRTEPSVSMH
jgi:uncharacterized membrane protein